MVQFICTTEEDPISTLVVNHLARDFSIVDPTCVVFQNRSALRYYLQTVGGRETALVLIDDPALRQHFTPVHRNGSVPAWVTDGSAYVVRIGGGIGRGARGSEVDAGVFLRRVIGHTQWLKATYVTKLSHRLSHMPRPWGSQPDPTKRRERREEKKRRYNKNRTASRTFSLV